MIEELLSYIVVPSLVTLKKVVVAQLHNLLMDDTKVITSSNQFMDCLYKATECEHLSLFVYKQNIWGVLFYQKF